MDRKRLTSFGAAIAITTFAFWAGQWSLDANATARDQTAEAVLAEQKRADKKICMEVESVKTALRQGENENYSRLNRNLRILHIQPSPEILKFTKREHFQRLAHFAPRNCNNL